jgi:hypothetical protein
MKTTRYVAAGLLMLTATFQVAQIAMTPLDLTRMVTVAFGVVCLLIGVLLFRNHRSACYFGAAVSLGGLVQAIRGMLTQPTLAAGLFIALDVVVVACCLHLILRDGHSPSAAR